jgi:hypothetical protein
VSSRNAIANPLSQAGFEDIALPRRAILTGEVDPNFDTSLLVIALPGLALVGKVDNRVRRDLIANAEHQARVFLCWRYLTLNWPRLLAALETSVDERLSGPSLA